MDLASLRADRELSSALRILVVEDDPRIRLQIVAYLRHRGYEVLEAASADDALLLLDRGRAVDCVFSDVQMPGRHDGVGLARWILLNRPELAVLLTSGNFRTEDLEPELRGTLPVLTKPYRGDAVEERLMTLMTAMKSQSRRPSEN